MKFCGEKRVHSSRRCEETETGFEDGPRNKENGSEVSSRRISILIEDQDPTLIDGASTNQVPKFQELGLWLNRLHPGIEIVDTGRR